MCHGVKFFFFFLRKINLPFELARSTMTNLETSFPRLLFKKKPVYLACVWVYCPHSAVFLDTVLIHARAYFLTEHAQRVRWKANSIYYLQVTHISSLAVKLNVLLKKRGQKDSSNMYTLACGNEKIPEREGCNRLVSSCSLMSHWTFH